MSARNGDKARFHSLRKRKLARRREMIAHLQSTQRQNGTAAVPTLAGVSLAEPETAKVETVVPGA